MYQLRLQQLVDQGRAQSIDVHSVPTCKVNQVPSHLGGTGEVDTPEYRLSLLPLRHTSTGGADIGNLIDRGSRLMLGHRHHLRDDVSRFPHDNGIP